MVESTPRPIWSKRTAPDGTAGPSARVLAYCAGRDVAPRPPADAELIPYDLWTNRAHCLMLRRCGIIAAKDHDAIRKGLDRLEKQWQAGQFQLDPSLEDVHMNIERYVAGAVGEGPAGVMHTARSRNDQSATDMRLWLRDRLLERVTSLAGLVGALARFARKHRTTLAPGWTHGQPAMPTSLGHWAAAHAWAIERDVEALTMLWPLIDECPLGSAASFGTSWPIDRALTARLLGFSAPSPNSLDAIGTRWESEARLGGALAIAMTHLSSLGQDLIFLSTPPRAGLRLAESHVTGSSIMPNKRNPDFAEVTRARAQGVHGLLSSLNGVGRGALSGYNRDTQWTKYWIMDLLWEVGEAPDVFTDAIEGMKVDEALLGELATAGFSLAADLADHIARTRKLPFRKAYHVVAEAVARDEARGWVTAATLNEILGREKIAPAFDTGEIAATGDPVLALSQRQSMGGPSPESVASQAAQLLDAARSATQWAKQTGRKLESARKACLK